MTERQSWLHHPLVQPLRSALATHRDAVLQAPPGAGKSTIVPLALLADEWSRHRTILMLEPRRLATRAVAQRLAHNLGEQVGETVGYRMRLDTRVSRATRLEVITEGVLTRRLQDDPALEGVAWVIFDEFHERRLQADLGLALCIESRAQLESGLRVLVMSATLDGQRVAGLLEDAPVIDVPGRAYPVQLHYVGRGAPLLPAAPGAPVRTAQTPEQLMLSTLRRALAETQGDTLVFLPGAGEIRRLQQALAADLPARTVVLPLYGELSGEAQDLALQMDAAGRRRVILATNIAETSLTIEGVTVVVDSGLVRRSRFDPVTGMSRLELMRISRSSAEQRAGRAGRTAPGLCFRLWSEGAQASLAAHTPPEILEADLAPLALELAAWGARDASALSWLDPPPAAPLAQARELLLRLGAVRADGRITEHGRRLARLPVHPRLAHLMYVARRYGRVNAAAEMAALLSERDLLRGSGDRDPDVRARLALLRREATAAGAGPALQRARRQAEMLARSVRDATDEPRRGEATDRNAPDELALLASAFPDRIGQRRAGDAPRYLLANGRGAAFRGVHSLGRSEYLVALELDDSEREARIDLAAPLARADLLRLFDAEIEVEESVSWDEREQAVLARRQRRLGALVLDVQALLELPADKALAAMLAGVRSMGLECLPWDESSRNLQARLQFVRGLGRGDLTDWPASDDQTLLATLEEWLAPWLAGCTRRTHLARLALGEALRARLSGAQQRALEELAPRHFTAPTGSQLRIDYQGDNAPGVEVRLQEVFGIATTPRVGGGATPLTFKLLSPAQRPVQITRDLAGFWRGSYADVRKDLRGRYPKHYWPEDPLQAEPRRGTRPPRH